jgi:hypothetical protein
MDKILMDKIFFACVAVFFGLSFSYRRCALDEWDAYLLRAAMACTVAADFCMLILYDNPAGLVCFCAAQTLYHFRFVRAGRRAALFSDQTSQVQTSQIFKTFRVFLFQAAACFAALLFWPDWTRKLAVCYAVCLLCAVSAALIGAKKYPRPNRLILSAGMTLFLLCDIHVGLYHWPNLSLKARAVYQILIWVFYLPSQLLLAFSAKNFSARGWR